MMRWLATAAVVALLSAAQADAACNPQIDRISAPRNDPYDPFTPDIAIFSIEVNIRNRGDARCDLRLVALSESAGQRRLVGSSSRAAINYDLVSGTSVRLPNEDSANFGQVVSLAPKGEQTIRLQMMVNPGQVVPSGHYDDHLRLRLIGADGADLGNARRVPVSVNVQPRAQVNVAGGSTSFLGGVRSAALDLGELQDGATGRVFIQVRANAAVRLHIRSTHRGRLRHTSLSSEVPYQLVVDGSRLNLADGSSIRRRPPPTLDGAAYEAVVTVVPGASAFAGEYRDVITISVDADG